MSAVVVPLYKVLLNLGLDMDARTKLRVDSVRTMIEGLLRLPQVERLVTPDCFEFDKHTRSLVLSILQDRFSDSLVLSDHCDKSASKNIELGRHSPVNK